MHKYTHKHIHIHTHTHIHTYTQTCTQTRTHTHKHTHTHTQRNTPSDQAPRVALWLRRALVLLPLQELQGLLGLRNILVTQIPVDLSVTAGFSGVFCFQNQTYESDDGTGVRVLIVHTAYLWGRECQEVRSPEVRGHPSLREPLAAPGLRSLPLHLATKTQIQTGTSVAGSC